MSELTVADIKAAVHEVIEEQRQNFWVEPEEHWRHHEQLRMCVISKPEWEENHRYVSDLRRMGGHVKRVGLGASVVAAVAWMLKSLFGWGG